MTYAVNSFGSSFSRYSEQSDTWLTPVSSHETKKAAHDECDRLNDMTNGGWKTHCVTLTEKEL